MHISALPFLRHPATGEPLKLDPLSRDGAWIIDGVLRSADQSWFPVIEGLPTFPSDALWLDLRDFCRRYGLAPPTVARDDASGQTQTNLTFSDKWKRFRKYGLEPTHQGFLQGWYAKKFGLGSASELPEFFGQFRYIMEVGPGSGFNSRFMAQHCPGQVFAVDISEAARTTMENTRDLPNCHAINADLFHVPFADDMFDFVVADGVLHHTPSTRKAVETLYRKVKPGGQFFFYLYKEMGPARSFVDQHIRERFKRLSPEECYAACEAITDLGRALSRLQSKITLEKPISILGIPAGTHDVQRLIYYNFIKCFWNDAFDYETNNMVNFDWYHPHHAWQHTQEEVEGWLAALGVTDFRIHDANPNGISALIRKGDQNVASSFATREGDNH
jgi:SAM-dependent methyltransferase